MKVISYILIASLAFMGLNHFMHSMENQFQETETTHCMDCCGTENARTQDQGDRNEKSAGDDQDHPCPPGCEGSCCFHLTAIHYQFVTLPGLVVQNMDYLEQQDIYHFEYFIPFFQPPRLS